jgi:hypothetical protein
MELITAVKGVIVEALRALNLNFGVNFINSIEKCGLGKKRFFKKCSDWGTSCPNVNNKITIV